MSSSYRRYREYQANRQQFKMDQIAAPVVMMLIIGFLTKYGWAVAGVIGALVVIRLYKKYSVSKVKQETIEEPVKLELIKEDAQVMKSTEQGYVNKNNQKNNGRTNKPGTDYGQWYYAMECLSCGHTYNANGTDIWQRKCPKCQGGRP